MIVAIVVTSVVDYLIIRWVRRTARRPMDDEGSVKLVRPEKSATGGAHGEFHAPSDYALEQRGGRSKVRPSRC